MKANKQLKSDGLWPLYDERQRRRCRRPWMVKKRTLFPVTHTKTASNWGTLRKRKRCDSSSGLMKQLAPVSFVLVVICIPERRSAEVHLMQMSMCKRHRGCRGYILLTRMQSEVALDCVRIHLACFVFFISCVGFCVFHTRVHQT